MSRMHIGIDLDGVGYPFVTCLAQWARAHGYPKARASTWQTWAGHDAWGLDTQTFLEMCHDAADAGHLFTSQAPYPGFVEMMHRLHIRGHQTHIVTARSFGDHDGLASQLSTQAWLDEHQIPFTSLTFSHDKTIVDVDAFLEDNIDNYDALERAGRHPFLIKLEYDDTSEPRYTLRPSQPPRRVVHDHAEFLDEVDRITDNHTPRKTRRTTS